MYFFFISCISFKYIKDYHLCYQLLSIISTQSIHEIYSALIDVLSYELKSFYFIYFIFMRKKISIKFLFSFSTEEN